MRLIYIILLFVNIVFANNIVWFKVHNKSNCKIGFSYIENIKSISFNGKCKNGYALSGMVKIFTTDKGTIIYEGDFKDGLFNGIGELDFANGDILAGYFKNGYPYKNMTVIKDGNNYMCEVDNSYNLQCEGAANEFGKSRQVAVARWTGDYVRDVAKNTKEMFKPTAKKKYSGGNIKIQYEGYNTSTKHYVYNLYVKDSYDGQIFYYKDKDTNSYVIMTTGISKGNSVNGNYFTSGYTNLTTSQCGDTHVSGIDEAIKKVANCIYKGYY